MKLIYYYNGGKFFFVKPFWAQKSFDDRVFSDKSEEKRGIPIHFSSVVMWREHKDKMFLDG